MSAPGSSSAPILPRWFITGAALLMVGALAGTAIARLSGASAQQIPDAPVRLERQLKFEDTPTGHIHITDAETNQLILAVQPGASSFMRGAVRALARERKKAGIGAEHAFRLISRTDGRLTLLDPMNGQRVDLESFGPSNAAVFFDLLSRASTEHKTELSAASLSQR
jgi:putative photosynthetic complex assembly protein